MPRLTGPRRSVAVVGSGISGLTAAHLLRRGFDVTLYEADDRFGGHAHTHVVGDERIDSGFRVFDERSSPLLRRLLDQLDVTTTPVEPSVGVRCDGCGLEYVDGRGPRGLYAQRRRALDPRFARLVEDIGRFRTLALELAKSLDPASVHPTYAEFLARHGFGAHFVRHHAVPLASGPWPTGSPLPEPAKHVCAVLRGRGLLREDAARSWRAIDGGARSHVDAMTALVRESLVRSRVTAVTRTGDGVEVATERRTDRFDHVVLAIRADEALTLLTDPTADETAVLGAFASASTTVAVHRDAGVLPRSPRAWATWNHRLADCAAPVVSSWLQRTDGERPWLVTSDEAALAHRIDEDAVLTRMEYTHALLSRDAVAARRRLPGLNSDRTVFAGAHHGWGRHEDGCRAGIAAATHLGAAW